MFETSQWFLHGFRRPSLGVLYDARRSTEHQSSLAVSSVSCPARCYKTARQKCDRLLSGVLSTQQSMSLLTAITLISMYIVCVIRVVLHSTRLSSRVHHMTSSERFALSLLLCQNGG